MNKVLTVKINKQSFLDNYQVDYDNEHQFQLACKAENNRYEEIYGMPLPTDIELHLLPSLVEKMKKIEQFCSDNGVSKSQFGSAFAQDHEFSYAYLLNNGVRITPTFYTEMDMTYERPSFNEKHFTIVYDYLYQGFKLKLYYVNSYVEFTFESYFFQLD